MLRASRDAPIGLESFDVALDLSETLVVVFKLDPSEGVLHDAFGCADASTSRDGLIPHYLIEDGGRFRGESLAPGYTLLDSFPPREHIRVAEIRGLKPSPERAWLTPAVVAAFFKVGSSKRATIARNCFGETLSAAGSIVYGS